QRLVAQLAQLAAIAVGEVGRDDAIAEASDAIYLRRGHFSAVARRDQHRRPRFAPRERAYGMTAQPEAAAFVRHRLARPEHAPDDDMPFEVRRPAPVRAGAR